MNRPTRLVWIDLEMTGLRPQVDLITDVAVIITDFSLKELASYQSSISHPEAGLRRLMAASPWHAAQPDYVAKIIRDCLGGKSQAAVIGDILQLFHEQKCLTKALEKYPHFPDSLEAKGDVYLAGNSIATDRAFIDAQWPEIARTLHYRMLDVSSFKLWEAGLGREQFQKSSTHRALDDIRDSIAEFRYYVHI
jgi:oligoribonuclease